MPTYLITGVSRGLGWAFLDRVSSDKNNTVIGIVRNKAETEKRIGEELAGRSNIQILEADLTDYEAVKKAAEETAAITGGKLDYLIANAAYLPQFDVYDGIGALGETPKVLMDEFNKTMSTNVLSTIHLYNLFLPQILAGDVKKVLLLSTGMADAELARAYDLEMASIYAASKAAANMITAKFNAQYRRDGVLFLGVCPGMVDTGHYENATPGQLERAGQMAGKFREYAPHFQGPATPADATKDVLSVLEQSSVEGGQGGAYLSHLGNKQWL